MLSVKVEVPNYFCDKFVSYCQKKFVGVRNSNSQRERLLHEAIKDAYGRLSILLDFY